MILETRKFLSVTWVSSNYVHSNFRVEFFLGILVYVVQVLIFLNQITREYCILVNTEWVNTEWATEAKKVENLIRRHQYCNILLSSTLMHWLISCTFFQLNQIFNQIRYTLGSNLANSRWYPLEVKAQLTAKVMFFVRK